MAIRVLRISHSGNVSAYRERERALDASGQVEVALICPSEWQHLGQSDKHIEERFLTRQIKTIGTGNIPLFAYEPQTIIKIMKDFRPDVVDIHEEPYSVSGFQCLLLAQKFAPNAAVVFYSAQNINKRYPYPFRWTEQYVYRNTQGAYPCSIGVQEVLLQKGLKKPCPVIPLGVNPDAFNPDGALLRDWRQNGCHVIGFTGRLIESKGLQVILKAIPLLRKRLPAEDRIKVLVAGAGPAQSMLAEQATQLGLQDTVAWLGELKQSQMAEFYRSCSVLVVPSLTTATWKEQFGRVPVEAMSCDVPVIVSDSGSLPEVVHDCGMIVPEADPEPLAASLYQLLSDRKLWERYSKLGRQAVLSRFTWTAVSDAMIALYSQAQELKRNPKNQASTPYPASATERVNSK